MAARSATLMLYHLRTFMWLYGNGLWIILEKALGGRAEHNWSITHADPGTPDEEKAEIAAHG